jgi:hypothetical protein
VVFAKSTEKLVEIEIYFKNRYKCMRKDRSITLCAIGPVVFASGAAQTSNGR